MAEKNKLAAMIVSGLGKKSKPEEESEEVGFEDESEMGDEETAAQEIIDSIQSGDAVALAEALRSFISIV